MVGVAVGVDIGTSSSKGVLVDLDGQILATATRTHVVDRPHPGWVEIDAAVWWDEFTSIVAQLLQTDPALEVKAVGVSGMGPCVLLTGTDMQPLRPAILYGVDTRATEQIGYLNTTFGQDAIFSRGGSMLSSQAVGPKLVWVKDNEPALFARANRLFMPSSWLGWHLTGEYYLDHHSASQCTPLYDTGDNSWYRPWASAIAPEIALPLLVWAGEVVGTVTAKAAAETGLPTGIPVIAGSIDAWMEAASVGADQPGDLMLMYGTTMFLIAPTVSPVTYPTLWATAGLAAGTRTLAGGMASSGAITSWLRSLFGSPDYVALLDEAHASGAGAHGLLMLPYFAGERTPVMDPDARGALVGLTVEHTRGDLYRAALEAVAFGVRHNLDSLHAAGIKIRRIVAVGGGTQGDLWTQIVSDVTGLPQTIPRVTIGASYGAAYLAASAIADVEIDQWNPASEQRIPDPDMADVYDRLYISYLALYPALQSLSHELARFQTHQPSRQPA